MIWVCSLIILGVTIMTVANCRKVPDPWVPQVDGNATPAAE